MPHLFRPMRMKSAIPFFLPALLLAQPPQPVVQDPAKARLESQVLSAVSNEPLRKTRLTLRMNVAALTAQRQQQPRGVPSCTMKIAISLPTRDLSPNRAG
jgi:hypothetical protein